jgi:adenylate kinase family enzyme
MNKKTPNRIAIIGNPGSGKSTFATRLEKLLNIPVHHMDTHVFVNGKKTDQQKLIKIQQELVDQDSWIIEGCSISTLEMRFEKADVVIYLNFPRVRCIWRVLKRCFVFDKNLANSGCVRVANWALLKYIWNFDKDKKPRIYEVKNKYPKLNFQILKNSRQIESFLKEWRH